MSLSTVLLSVLGGGHLWYRFIIHRDTFLIRTLIYRRHNKFKLMFKPYNPVHIVSFTVFFIV